MKPEDMPADPKGDAGAKKTPLHLLPPGACADTAKVLGLGADKYGPWNWRTHSVKASTYVGAIKRHLDAWWDGEEIDPESGLTHMAHIAASAMIVMDAARHDTLIEDHPAGSTFHLKGDT